MPEKQEVHDHPDQAAMLALIAYWRVSYIGGSSYKAATDDTGEDILPRHAGEGEKRYGARKAGTPTINICAEFTRLRRDGVMGAPVARPELERESPDEVFKAWMGNVDRGGHDMHAFMGRQLGRALTLKNVWLGVNAPPSRGDAGHEVSRLQQIEDPLSRAWATWAAPDDVRDVEYDAESGELIRLVVRHERTLKASFLEKAKTEEYWIEWTPDVYRRIEKNDKGEVVVYEDIPHGFKRVPWFKWEPLEEEQSYVGRFADLQKALLQTRSHILAEQVSCSFTHRLLLGGDPKKLKDVEVLEGSITVVEGAEEARLEVISGDPTVMQELRANFVADLMEAQRRSEFRAASVAQQRSVESGVAKAYDLQDLAALLTHLAASTQAAENRLIRWWAEAMDYKPAQVEAFAKTTYSDSFDVLSAEARFEQLKALLDRASLPQELKRMVLSDIVTMLYRMDTEERAAVLEEIKGWSESPGRQLLGGARTGSMDELQRGRTGQPREAVA